MRWFKHMTCAYDDEKLSAAVDLLGMEGYGFFWRILEVVAEKLDGTGDCSCTFSSKKWGGFFGFSARKFEKFVRIFAEKRIFSVEFLENSITVAVPNLLKYKDEWTSKKGRNSGVAPEKIRSKDIEEDKDKIKSTPPLSSLRSESAPPGGPRVHAHARAGEAPAPLPEAKAPVSRRPPTRDEVQAYCDERGNGIQAERFCDYYAAQGWRLSNGQPLRDWKAAVRNWELRNRDRPGRNVTAFPSGLSDAERRQAHNNAVCRQVAAELDAMGGPF